jgi:hypothetical protein
VRHRAPRAERGYDERTVPFEIIEHPGDAIFEILPILEVIYPAHPTRADIDAYVARAYEMIDAQRGRPFCCLADQRALQVMPPELVTALGKLNGHAYGHGMRCTARLVSSAIAGLQAHRLAREHHFELQAFEQRDDALLWLREKRK